MGRVGLLSLIFILAGCRCPRNAVCEALKSRPAPPSNGEAIAQGYRVGCPDILGLVVAGRTDLSGPRTVRANGCIDLGDGRGVRVEGLRPPEIEAELAALLGLERSAVEVRIDEFRSQHVYVFGQVAGQQRAVPYQGPETVVDLLHRAGGLTPGSAAAEVRVVRYAGLIQDDPEVFPVNLRAILIDGDARSNITIQPFDQIYVPETKESRVGKCVPPALRPASRWMGWLVWSHRSGQRSSK